jgi:hypothetical protein
MARTVAFSNVLYVTAAENDQWFVPTTGRGDNPDSGTMAQRLAQCQQMLDVDGDDTQIGKAVQADSLADW